MRNFSDRSCSENQTHISCSVSFFPPRKSWFLWSNVENIVEPGRPQMTIWRMRIAWWIPKATDTLNMWFYCFSTAKKKLQMLPNITLHIQCLSFYFWDGAIRNGLNNQNENFVLLRGPYLEPMCNVLSPIFTAVVIVLRHLYIVCHSGVSFPA